MLPDSSIELAPFDSTLYFLYPSCTTLSGGSPGKWPWCPNRRTFPRAGDYSIRVACHASIRKWTDRAQPTGGSLPEIWSNEVALRFVEPAPREAKVLDALWRSRAVTNTYSRGESHRRGGSDEQHLDRLRAIAMSKPHSPMIKYVKYATARMLIDAAIDWPDRSMLFEGTRILSDDLARRHPDFRPDEVAYYLALAELRGDQAGMNPYGRRRAREVMSKLMENHSELRNNNDIFALSNLVTETGEEIEVRLAMDKNEYVIGEPMLLRISLVNRSSRRVWVPGPTFLVPHGPSYCCYIEIERPDGVRELRSANRSLQDGISVSGRQKFGVALAPGDSIVSPPSYGTTEVASEAFGYRYTERGLYAFATPGRYRVSAAYGLPDMPWGLNGAGRLTRSKSVDVNIREPDAKEAEMLESLRRATEESVFNAIASDTTGVRLLESAIRSNREHPLVFYLERALAQTCWIGPRGMSADLLEALHRFEELERTSSDLRKQEIRMKMLEVYRSMKDRGLLDVELHADAEDLIAAMQASDRSLCANQEFIMVACALHFAQYDYRAYYAADWWLRSLTDAGPHTPSWDKLRVVVETSAPRLERTGPFQPRSVTKHRHHLLR
jgi:hypothetical protein